MSADDEERAKECEREVKRFDFDVAGLTPRAYVPPSEEAEVTLTTTHIERILSNFVAAHGGVRTPFAYAIKWLWSPDQGPLAHVKVVQAPDKVRPTPSRLVRKKG